MGTPPDDRAGAAPPGRVASREDARALDGPLLRSLFEGACALLQRHIGPLNAINVYPVPDGDTGTNMHLTLRAGVDALARATGGSVAEAAQALAQGALMGARGNSGVILSQILGGFAKTLDGRREADGATLAAAFAAGVKEAYDAISEPVEGTILTVIREAAEAVERAQPATASDALATAAVAAREAVDRTPELLPVLKAAGVVDAGGLGLFVIIEGLRRALAGEPLDVDLAPQSAVDAAWRGEAATLHRREHGESGYCTEFVVSGERIDAATARVRLGGLGTSLLVVDGVNLLRVHLHTTQPDNALAYGRGLGSVSHVKVDNLEAQIRRFVAQTPPPAPVASVEIVAVAAGEGIQEAFRSVGVSHLVEGGQTMNPSAGEILQAIEACPAAQVVVLPNNKNIIGAAKQAAEQSTKRVAVVPSRTVPQGVAAVLALNPDLPFEANLQAMERALATIRSAEVARAVRDTVHEGQLVRAGQAIGIIDGALRVVADDVATAVVRCVEEMRWPEASLLTLYAGADVRDEDAEALAGDLRARNPALEVEIVAGGQPHYPYILSLE